MRGSTTQMWIDHFFFGMIFVAELIFQLVNIFVIVIAIAINLNRRLSRENKKQPTKNVFHLASRIK